MAQTDLNRMIINLGAAQVNASSGCTALAVIDRNVSSVLGMCIPAGLTPELCSSINQLKTCVGSWNGIRSNLESFFRYCSSITANFRIDGSPSPLLVVEVDNLGCEVEKLVGQIHVACSTLNCFQTNLETAVTNVATCIDNCKNQLCRDPKEAQSLQQQAEALRCKLRGDWWGCLTPSYNFSELVSYVNQAKEGSYEGMGQTIRVQSSLAQNLMCCLSCLDPLATNLRGLQGNIANIGYTLSEACGAIQGAKQLLQQNCSRSSELGTILKSYSTMLKRLQTAPSVRNNSSELGY
jgi:hypothetical protein